MSPDRETFIERLPHLIALARDLDLPYRVLPLFPEDSIVPLDRATVTLEVAAGEVHVNPKGPVGWVNVDIAADIHRAHGRWLERVREPVSAEQWLSEDEPLGPGV